MQKSDTQICLRNRATWRFVYSTIVVLLVGALLSSGPAHAQSKNSLHSLSASFQELSRRVAPAVVQVLVTSYRPVQEVGVASSHTIAKQRGTGSGVILNADGYIVTNAHVVEGAHRVRVRLPTTAEDLGTRNSALKRTGRIVRARIVGIDRETDLAVLKIKQQGLPYLELRDSDELRQGELVLAFGSPLGLYDSVSLGVVSSVARQLQPENPVVYIQTDATINPGNSGGPLVDSEGRVVGINTLILSQSGGSEGIGFAVPSNIVKNVFEQIRSAGRVRRGQIGVNAQTISPVLARGLGLSQDLGVILADVHPGGPALAAGLRVGDIILTLDGKVMENGRQFDVNLYQRRIGEKVTIEYVRQGKTRVLDVFVVERANDPARLVDLVRPEENLIPALGLLIIDLDTRIAAMLPQLRSRSGVVVAARAVNGPVWRSAFQPGDVIYAINRVRIRQLSELRQVTKNFDVGDAVVIQVQRGAELQYVSFEID